MSTTTVYAITKQQKAIITQEIEELEVQRIAAGKIAEQWNDDVHENYNGHGTKAIMNMRAYHQNIRNGFGKSNNEEFYITQCKKDKDGTWLEEALRGAELYLVAQSFTNLICEKKKERGDYEKYSRVKK